MCGGTGIDGVLIALLAVRQRCDGQGGAAARGVLVLNERGERLVRREHFIVQCRGDLFGQALLIFDRKVFKELLRGLEEGIGVNDALALSGNFLDEELHGHQVVFHAGTQDFGRLRKHARNLTEARDVVLVVL